MKELTVSETAGILSAHDNILILTHKRPDGDALGSAAALCSGLRRIGKKAFILPNDGVTSKFLPFIQKYYASDEFISDEKNKYIVSVDVASLSLLTDGAPENIKLAVDHHPSNTGFADCLLLESGSSSCGEIILKILNEMCGGISKEEADLLYIAVSTDTGCFMYGNTNENTFMAAAALAAAGADVGGLNIKFFRSTSRARLVLEGLIYSSLISSSNGRINIAVVTKSMVEKAGASTDDLDDLASLPGRVEGNIVSALIRETDQGYSKISLRSNGQVNVSDICAMYGGGGHAMAAGCEIEEIPETAAGIIKSILETSLS